jgi:hypothetical protein
MAELLTSHLDWSVASRNKNTCRDTSRVTSNIKVTRVWATTTRRPLGKVLKHLVNKFLLQLLIQYFPGNLNQNPIKLHPYTSNLISALKYGRIKLPKEWGILPILPHWNPDQGFCLVAPLEITAPKPPLQARASRSPWLSIPATLKWLRLLLVIFSHVSQTVSTSTDANAANSYHNYYDKTWNASL